MVNKKQLEEVYKQNLENDIINILSEMKGIDLRKALDIYYSSKLALQISEDNSRTKINPTDSRFSLDLWDFSFCPFL